MQDKYNEFAILKLYKKVTIKKNQRINVDY